MANNYNMGRGRRNVPFLLRISNVIALRRRTFDFFLGGGLGRNFFSGDPPNDFFFAPRPLPDDQWSTPYCFLWLIVKDSLSKLFCQMRHVRSESLPAINSFITWKYMRRLHKLSWKC